MKSKPFTVICLSVIVGAAIWIIVGWYNLRTQNTFDAVGQDVAADSLPPATLEFEQQIADFGRVSPDTLLSATFIARNTSANDLVIHYVNPDCSCTGYNLSKTTTLPGDTLSITLQLDTRGKRGHQRLQTTVCANTHVQMYSLILKADIGSTH